MCALQAHWHILPSLVLLLAQLLGCMHFLSKQACWYVYHWINVTTRCLNAKIVLLHEKSPKMEIYSCLIKPYQELRFWPHGCRIKGELGAHRCVSLPETRLHRFRTVNPTWIQSWMICDMKTWIFSEASLNFTLNHAEPKQMHLELSSLQ